MKTAKLVDWYGNAITKQMPKSLAYHLAEKKNKKALCNSQKVYVSFN